MTPPAVTGNRVVAAQSFSPFAGAITSQRLATGQVRVTFQGMNLANPFGFVNAATGINNVIVQRTCSNEVLKENCVRSVCVPTAWSFGTQSTDNTTVDVQCQRGSTAVDVDFRVFIGNQSHTSQHFDDARWSGSHYAWAKSPGFAGGGQCRESSQFTHRAARGSIS